MTPQQPSYADVNLFVLDGLAPRGSPALLLDLPLEAAAALMRRGMEGRIEPYLPRAAAGVRLLEVDCREAIGLSPADIGRYCSEIEASRAWTVLTGLEVVLQHGRPFHLLGSLCDMIAQGRLPPVAAITEPEHLGDVISAAPRFAGLARTIDRSAGTARFVELTSIASEAEDKTDVGWSVVVRFTLQADIGDDFSIGGLAADDALRMVDGRLRVIAENARRPDGVLVSFLPEALTAGERTRASTAAELIGRRLVGRLLGGAEAVVATRSVFWY